MARFWRGPLILGSVWCSKELVIGELGSWGGKAVVVFGQRLVGVVTARAATVRRLQLCDGDDGDEGEDDGDVSWRWKETHSPGLHSPFDQTDAQGGSTRPMARLKAAPIPAARAAKYLCQGE